MNISTRTTGTKIKTVPGQGPIIRTRDDQDRDLSSGPEMTGTGPAPGTVPVLETFSGVRRSQDTSIPGAHQEKVKKNVNGFL